MIMPINDDVMQINDDDNLRYLCNYKRKIL